MALSKAAPTRHAALRAIPGARAGCESLRMEIAAAGQEMRSAGLEIAALLLNHNDLAIAQEAARLVARGQGYIDRGKAA